MAPNNGDNILTGFSFYMAGPFQAGNIDLSAYIAPWTGTMAGAPVYISPEVNYANTGNANLSFSTGGIALTPGAEYVMFLSTSQYYDTVGLSYISQGAATIPGGNFVYYNNGNNYGELFTHSWDATALKPDWAVTANFTNAAPVPEPQYLVFLLTVVLGTLVMVRKRLGRNAPTES